MGRRYEEFAHNPELVQALTSLTVEEIAELAGVCQVVWLMRIFRAQAHS